MTWKWGEYIPANVRIIREKVQREMSGAMNNPFDPTENPNPNEGNETMTYEEWREVPAEAMADQRECGEVATELRLFHDDWRARQLIKGREVCVADCSFQELTKKVTDLNQLHVNQYKQIELLRRDLKKIAEELVKAAKDNDWDYYNDIVDDINNATSETWLRKMKVTQTVKIMTEIEWLGYPDEYDTDIDSLRGEIESAVRDSALDIESVETEER